MCCDSISVPSASVETPNPTLLTGAISKEESTNQSSKRSISVCSLVALRSLVMYIVVVFCLVPTLLLFCSCYIVEVYLVLKGWNFLALDATKFHLFLELACIANTRKEMWLTTAVGIESSKPLIPLFLYG